MQVCNTGNVVPFLRLPSAKRSEAGSCMDCGRDRVDIGSFSKLTSSIDKEAVGVASGAGFIGAALGALVGRIAGGDAAAAAIGAGIGFVLCGTSGYIAGS